MFKNVNWFKLNRSLHRDIGYFCVGMTLIFAISGIALNHVEDWNPNYQVIHDTQTIPALKQMVERDSFEADLLISLQLDSKIKARFWQSPSQLKLFTTSEQTLMLNLDSNQVIIEQIKPRPILRSLNFLHLNEARKAWTYFSDLYAVMLIFLALSALFMIKGKKGVWGPRAIIVIAGFAAPLAFIFYYAS